MYCDEKKILMSKILSTVKVHKFLEGHKNLIVTIYKSKVVISPKCLCLSHKASTLRWSQAKSENLIATAMSSMITNSRLNRNQL